MKAKDWEIVPWKLVYALVLSALIVIVLVFLLYYGAFNHLDTFAQGVLASIVWGAITLVLSLIFMLGAAQTEMQFLVFFGTGAFGAGMGYLVGAWLTPSGDSNPLDQIRNIAAGVLTGVVGTKLLALWDDLVKEPADPKGLPRILTAAYFVPMAMFLVGFTVSLSAFYTVRSADAGGVTITYSPQSDVTHLVGNTIGIMPGKVVTFAGAANSPVDVTVDWGFRIKAPCVEPKSEQQMEIAFDKKSGILTTPNEADHATWAKDCGSSSPEWTLTATSKQNRSKFSAFVIRFCAKPDDCNPEKPPPPNPPSNAAAPAGSNPPGAQGAGSKVAEKAKGPGK